MLRRAPLSAVGLLSSLLGGRARFKHFVSARFVPEPGALRWRPEVIDFLRAQHSTGREIILVTAAHRRIAETVAQHLGFFSRVLATDEATNLKGPAKLQALRAARIERFDFVSDSVIDLPVLAVAERVYLVAPTSSLERAECLQGRVEAIFCPRRVAP